MDVVQAWKKEVYPGEEFEPNQVFGFIRYLSYVNAETASILSKYFLLLEPAQLVRMAFELTGRGCVYDGY